MKEPAKTNHSRAPWTRRGILKFFTLSGLFGGAVARSESAPFIHERGTVGAPENPSEKIPAVYRGAGRLIFPPLCVVHFQGLAILTRGEGSIRLIEEDGESISSGIGERVSSRRLVGAELTVEPEDCRSFFHRLLGKSGPIDIQYPDGRSTRIHDATVIGFPSIVVARNRPPTSRGALVFACSISPFGGVMSHESPPFQSSKPRRQDGPSGAISGSQE